MVHELKLEVTRLKASETLAQETCERLSTESKAFAVNHRVKYH